MDQITPYCPQFQDAMEVLGRRWTGAIVRAMLAGRTRFSELTETIPDLTDRLLSIRLKELESEGIVTRHVEPTRPVRIEYRLTDKGRELADVVTLLGDWAHRHSTPEQKAAYAAAKAAESAESAATEPARQS
ncbi:helix-turn-helix domain-containing protein [Crossiella sp. CA-258035]|uniref:winged helix-turn-helix transcriptional regulator n=1 Tax=Crossiella sp. CA-258035 TaxID=2981138 RepID=UPI0024BCBB6D|nr:helix-turn-helix domain-containing protein [Crossiella sp. CA-258035]WHT17950.1 helix-turn-helix domain-containing protein [Crossiella sp. CA-258035]